MPATLQSKMLRHRRPMLPDDAVKDPTVYKPDRTPVALWSCRRLPCTILRVSELSRKLHPSRFPGMSPFMAAIVGYVLGESFTDPEIAEIKVSETENLVYVRQAGSARFEGLQSLVDLRNNWNRLIDVAGLAPEERKEAVSLFVARVEKVAGTEV